MESKQGDGRPSDGRKCGKVFRKSLGQYSVVVDGEVVLCSVSSKLRKELIYPVADPTSLPHRVVSVEEIKMVDPIAVGDEVSFVDAGDATGMIVEVLPRRNRLSRRGPGPKPLEQVIVANVDQVVIVMAVAQPKLKWGLLDRYLVSAEAAGIPALICITKIDLADERAFLEELAAYEEIGYPSLLTSAVTGRGIEELKAALRGRVSVFAGTSGVGKTTLLNTLQPGLGLKVSEVSGSTRKGRHTTSHLEMFPLDFGGSVVDTPGIREFGLWRIGAQELAGLFPEMRPYIGRCRFGLNCTHSHEPDCAIKRAVEERKISERRHQSYLKLRG
jgi:ribosome biogenesis GTPase